LIRKTVWPQCTNVTDRQTDRQDRQRTDSIWANRFTNGRPNMFKRKYLLEMADGSSAVVVVSTAGVSVVFVVATVPGDKIQIINRCIT